jgi:hypothetical protein
MLFTLLPPICFGGKFNNNIWCLLSQITVSVSAACDDVFSLSSNLDDATPFGIRSGSLAVKQSSSSLSPEITLLRYSPRHLASTLV